MAHQDSSQTYMCLDVHRTDAGRARALTHPPFLLLSCRRVVAAARAMARRPWGAWSFSQSSSSYHHHAFAELAHLHPTHHTRGRPPPRPPRPPTCTGQPGHCNRASHAHAHDPSQAGAAGPPSRRRVGSSKPRALCWASTTRRTPTLAPHLASTRTGPSWRWASPTTPTPRGKAPVSLHA